MVIINSKVEPELKLAVEDIAHNKIDKKGNRTSVSAYIRELLLSQPEIKKALKNCKIAK